MQWGQQLPAVGVFQFGQWCHIHQFADSDLEKLGSDTSVLVVGTGDRHGGGAEPGTVDGLGEPSCCQVLHLELVSLLQHLDDAGLSACRAHDLELDLRQAFSIGSPLQDCLLGPVKILVLA